MKAELVRTWLVLLAAAFSTDVVNVHAAPRAIITFDVESIDAVSLPKQVDLVCKDGSSCGLMEMVRMLNEKRWAGTFFLNVYENRRWGDATMRNIAWSLQAAGQDVALHTHPQWAYDSSRNGMYEYSLDEQITIIRDGVGLLENWTGRPVVSHRAGDYAADENTLVALERNGLRNDSSLFWQHPHCRLNGLGLPRNLPSFRGKITEIPVTVYQRESRPELLGNMFAPITTIRKLDAAWFVNEQEARAAIDAVIEADFPYLVLFLHSFSFIQDGGNDGEPVADHRTREIFRAMLDYVAERGLEVVTMCDLAQRGSAELRTPVLDIIPAVPIRLGLHRYFWHRIRTEGGALTAAAIVLVLVCAGLLLVARRWRRRTGNANGQQRDGRSAA